MGKVLSSALDGKEHLAAWDSLFEFRFATQELEKLLIMMIDTVDSRALPYLADQFDLLGFKGWNAAKTDLDRRSLIKRAIELKRYQGTDYAIRRAVQSVGYYDAQIIARPSALYNGKFKHNGLITYGSGHWATIAVILDIGEKKGIGADETNEAIELINEYKNARTKLLYVDYKCTLLDNVGVDEELIITGDSLFVEGVDPITDVTTCQANTAPMEDALNTLNDFGITINFVNSQGEVLLQETF